MSDSPPVELAAPGGVSAREDFGLWVTPHVSSMANLAARMVGSADRDDVVQESLARAWRKRETFDERRGSVRSWLLAIVADRARRHNRRRLRPRFAPERRSSEDWDSDGRLEAALAVLPRRQRMAVELHYFVDLAVAEVAAVMGCSEGTVKSALFDARARLRDELEEQ